MSYIQGKAFTGLCDAVRVRCAVSMRERTALRGGKRAEQGMLTFTRT